jgi:hypothetical protein
MFTFNLRITYWNNGFFNVGVVASALLGLNGQALAIIFPNGFVINSSINRTANNNGSVRTGATQDLAQYFQANYAVGVVINFEVINPNTIQLL